MVQSGELVISMNNYGLVLNLHKGCIGAVFISDFLLRVGCIVKRTFSLVNISTSINCLNLVVNGLGNDYQVKNFKFPKVKILFDPNYRFIELKAPGIVIRQSVYESLNTGLKIIDAIVPIGLGQRELIIGDRQTGKSSIAIDCILPKLIFLT